MHEQQTSSVRVDDGAELFWDQRGAGTPLLLLHGLTGTGADFAHLFALDRLAQEFCWLAPDARGHGRSTNPSGAFSFARNARDVLALLDALGLDTVRALGISLGANTLLHLATLAPGRIERAVLVSCAPHFPAATRDAFRAYAATPQPPAEWARMRAQHVHGDAQIEALFQLPARLADDREDMSFTADELARIDMDTLIVAGDRDPLYDLELALALYRGLPRAALWVVPEGGHSPVFGAFRAPFEQLALEFLRAPPKTDQADDRGHVET